MIDNKTSKMFRGIAMLMVMLSHFLICVEVEQIGPELRTFIGGWGVYGVDIFFMLSGYGLVKSANKSGINLIFVLKRFFNSYIPYIILAGFWVLYDKSFGEPGAVVDLLTGRSFWFMTVLFVLYILFMISYKIGKFREAILTVGVVGYCIYLYKSGHADFWYLSNAAFLVGVYAATAEGKIGKNAKAWFKRNASGLTAVITSVLVFLSLNKGYATTENGQIGIHLVMSLIFTVLVLLICAQTYGGGILLPAMGRFSLYIYLLHHRLFFMFLSMNERFGALAIVTLATLGVIFVGISVGYAFEWNLNQIMKLIENKLDNK